LNRRRVYVVEIPRMSCLGVRVTLLFFFLLRV